MNRNYFIASGRCNQIHIQFVCIEWIDGGHQFSYGFQTRIEGLGMLTAYLVSYRHPRSVYDSGGHTSLTGCRR